MFENIIDKFHSQINSENKEIIKGIFNKKNAKTIYADKVENINQFASCYILNNDFFRISITTLPEGESDIHFRLEKNIGNNEKIAVNFYYITKNFPFMEFDIYDKDTNVISDHRNIQSKYSFLYSIRGKSCTYTISDIFRMPDTIEFKESRGKLIDFISNNLNLETKELKEFISLQSDTNIDSVPYINEIIEFFKELNAHLENKPAKNKSVLSIKN